MGWHIVITEEMRAMGLSGNDLMVFALINGYSQSGQGCYFGSLSHLCEVCGVSRPTAVRTLRYLVESEFITKNVRVINGVKEVSYSIHPRWLKNLTEVVKKFNRGGKKTLPNNKSYNKSININILSNREYGFKTPSIPEIEAYCQEKGYQVDPETFHAFYESKGWMVGKTKMKSWKAALVTWDKRSKDKPRTTKPKESVFEHNLKVIDKMYGTNYHAEAYGKGGDQ